MNLHVPVLMLIALFASCAHLGGQTIRQAPTPAFPTIAAAINASVTGDIVEILPGTHTLPFPADLLTKNLVIRSTGGAAVTTLTGLTNKLIIAGGQTSATRIEGLTFTGSVGPAFGGAFVFVSSAPVVSNCRFINNVRLDGYDANGAAGSIYFANPTFENCLFDNNSGGNGVVANPNEVFANFGGNGGAIFAANSGLTITDCDFINNRSGDGGQGYPEISPDLPGQGGPGGDGGAIYAENSNIVLTRCRFIANKNGNGGPGGLDLTGAIGAAGGPGGQGGAIRTFGGTLTIEHCLFSGNETGSRTTTGGLVLDGRGGALSINAVQCELRATTMVSNKARDGGALNLDFLSGPATIRESTFVDNSATEVGGAIIQRNPTTLTATNNLFLANDAPAGSVIAVDTPGAAAIHVYNSIVYSNIGPHFLPATGFTEAQTFTVEHCDVEGTYPGTGNFDAVPDFADPFALDFHLTPQSPCIDAGNPALSSSTEDNEREPRVAGVTIDVGPDEFYGITAGVEGTIVDSNGDPEAVVLVDGSAGTPGRVKHIPRDSTYLLEVRNPSVNLLPSGFILFGTLGVPDPSAVFPVTFIGGNMAFTPYSADPLNPDLFVVANSATPSPAGFAFSTLAPWIVTAPPIAFQFSYTLQALVVDNQGQFQISNALAVIVD